MLVVTHTSAGAACGQAVRPLPLEHVLAYCLDSNTDLVWSTTYHHLKSECANHGTCGVCCCPGQCCANGHTLSQLQCDSAAWKQVPGVPCRKCCCN